MRPQHQRHRPWRWALAAAGVLLLSRAALAQVPPPADLVLLAKFSITGKATGSETIDTSAADYTVTGPQAGASMSTAMASAGSSAASLSRGSVARKSVRADLGILISSSGFRAVKTSLTPHVVRRGGTCHGRNEDALQMVG